MKRPQFETEEIYHIFNRGVEKRKIFTDDADYYRFVHDLFEFNDTDPALNTGYSFKNSGVNPKLSKPRKTLVEILAFCAMPNHFHLLLRQKVDKGITEFMRKFGTGYTNYFNHRNIRVGPLFQGTFKAVLIEKEAQLLYISHYIHLNPLDLVSPEWREQEIKNPKKAMQFLESYRWSSYLDYINKKNFPSITQRNFIKSIYGSGTSIDYKKDISEWLSGFSLGAAQDITLD